MSSPASIVLLGSTLTALAGLVGFLAYVLLRYMPIVGRIFEEKPMFLPLRVEPAEGGEDVRFRTRDGLFLAGTYLKSRKSTRAGVLVFCHEYLSDRWSSLPYVDHLRDLGFDLFSFDFRNHGRSPSDPDYQPMQWVTEHEVYDLQAALAYLRARPDADPAGVGPAATTGSAVPTARLTPALSFGSASWKDFFTSLSDTRSCGRLGPARLGSTVARSSSRASV